MDIYLIRHTTPDIKLGICYGQTDVKLDVSFLEERDMVQAKLPLDIELFKIYSSPLSRCLKLARALSTSRVSTDARLKELDFGEWEMQRWDTINPKQLEEWMNDFVQVSCPGGESYAELQTRVLDWWRQLIDGEDEQVLVVTHAGVIRALLSHLMGMPLSNSFRLTIDPGGVSQISLNADCPMVNFINR